MFCSKYQNIHCNNRSINLFVMLPFEAMDQMFSNDANPPWLLDYMEYLKQWGWTFPKHVEQEVYKMMAIQSEFATKDATAADWNDYRNLQGLPSDDELV